MLVLLALLAALLLQPAIAMAATVTWTGNGDGGTWEDSRNWSPQQLPGPADDAVVNIGFPTINSMVSVHSLTTKAQITVQSSGGLALGSGTSTIDHSGGVGQGGIYFVNAGPMSNAGTLILRGDAGGGGNLYQAGSLENNGTIECRLGLFSIWRTMLINRGSIRVRDGGTLDIMDAQLESGSVTSADTGSSLMGSMGTWTLADGSTLSGEVVGGGTLRVPDGATATLDDASLNDGWTLAGPGTFHVPSGTTMLLDDLDYGGGWYLSFLDDCTLQNDGTVRFRGPVMLENNVTVDNYGTFELASDSARLDSDARSTINNLGVFTKSAGTATSWVDSKIDNHGAVSATDGTLQFMGGGTSDGFFEGSAGGTVCLGSGEFVLRDPAGQSGSCFRGGVDVDYATLTVPAGATATFAGQNGFSCTYGPAVLRGPGTVEVPQGSVLAINDTGWEPYLRDVAVNNRGTVRCTGQAFLDSGAILSNFGTIELRAASNLLLNNLGAAPLIVNTGTLVKSSTAEQFSQVTAPFTNEGTVRVTGGTLEFGQDALQNYAGSTLTGGVFEVLEPGRLYLRGDYLRTLAAEVLISGPEARIETHTADDLVDLATVTSTGILRLEAGKALTTGALTSAGTIVIGADSTLAVNGGTFTQTAGETRLTSETSQLGSDDQVEVRGGTLGGIGTVMAPLDTPGGALSPAFDACGILSVTGPLSQSVAGICHVDIAGPAVGSGFDRVVVDGAATLGGTLEVHTSNGYLPAAGATFQIMTCTTRSGTFDHVVALPVGSASAVYSVTYNPTDVTLTCIGTDQVPPATTASGADDAWHSAPVTLTFSATDNAGGSGVARTEYSTNGGASWAIGTSATISAQGATTLLYRSTDAAGNVEPAKSATVKIDSAKPTTKAFAATVRRGRTVKLGYQVSDALPGCGRAAVTLKIYRGTKVKTTIKIKTASACNVKQLYKWRCTLAKGSYTLKVYATDLAGNAQSKVGGARLTVK
jgi:hypothetical protein